MSTKTVCPNIYVDWWYMLDLNWQIQIVIDFISLFESIDQGQCCS